MRESPPGARDSELEVRGSPNSTVTYFTTNELAAHCTRQFHTAAMSRPGRYQPLRYLDPTQIVAIPSLTPRHLTNQAARAFVRQTAGRVVYDESFPAEDRSRLTQPNSLFTHRYRLINNDLESFLQVWARSSLFVHSSRVIVRYLVSRPTAVK